MVVFGGRLEELDVQLVGERFASFVRYHSFVVHVALVAHQYHLSVVPRIRLDLRYPVRARTLARFTHAVCSNGARGSDNQIKLRNSLRYYFVLVNRRKS